MKFFSMIAVLLLAPVSAFANPGLEDLSFLEGHWRGGDSFVFEEIWAAPEGGVMTGMARGSAGDHLAVLEYIIITKDENGALVMRFKHYNADFTTWEEAGPVTLKLISLNGTDATFAANPPSETVKSIRYRLLDEETLQADIVTVKDGEDGGFSLMFQKMN